MELMTRRSFTATALSSLGASGLIAADVPRKSPEFTVTLPNGAAMNLGDLRGKVVAFACILTT